MFSDPGQHIAHRSGLLLGQRLRLRPIFLSLDHADLNSEGQRTPSSRISRNVLGFTGEMVRPLRRGTSGWL
jgi:hypothetical protein